MDLFPHSIETLAYPLFFLFLWVAAIGAVAHFTGWSKLAAKYTTNKSFPDNTKGWQSCAFGITSYKGIIWIGSDHHGLYLRTGPWILYRFQHPPLFIPWSAITKAERTRRFWLRFIKIYVRDPQISFELSDGAFKDNMQYLYENNLLSKDAE